MKKGIPAWVILLAVAAALFTSIPVLTGYLSTQNGERIFNGFEFQEDFHAYAAYIKSGVDGNPLLLVDKSTSETQDGRYIIVYFTLLALVTKLTGLSIDLAWNVSRFFIIIALLLASWKLFSRVFPRDETARNAYVLLALGGGLGWIVPTLGKIIPAIGGLYSTDLTYPLGYTLFAFSFHPLAMFGLIFFMGVVWFLLDYFEHGKMNAMIASTLCALLVFFDHPAAAIVAWPVLGIALAHHTLTHARGKSWRTKLAPWIPVALGGLLILIYTWWARQDPVYLFHQSYYLDWAKREPLIGYVLGLGIPLVLAAYAIVLSLARKKTLEFELKGTHVLFLAWLGVALGLSYFFPAGVKYLYLIWAPLAVFAAMGVHDFTEWLARKWPAPRMNAHAWTVLLLVLACLSAPFLVEKRIGDIQHADYYMTPGEDAGLRFLATQEKGIVLADYRTGSMISWRDPQLPLVAHGFLTIDFKDKQEQVARFFANDTPLAAQKNILETNHISYVVVGPNEAELGSLDPQLGLTLVFESGDTRIYRV